MSTATEQEIGGIDVAEAPDALARPPKEVTFVARCHNLILSLFPELRETHMGMMRKASPGYRLQFVGHNFTADAATRRDFEKFVAKYGRLYAYDDQDYEEIRGRSLDDWIRANYAYGSNNPDGFYEVTPQVPEPVEELNAILEAYMAGDEDRIEAVLDAEIAEWNRPQVVEKANLALEKLHLAKAAAVIAAREAEPRNGADETAGPEDP